MGRFTGGEVGLPFWSPFIPVRFTVRAAAIPATGLGGLAVGHLSRHATLTGSRLWLRSEHVAHRVLPPLQPPDPHPAAKTGALTYRERAGSYHRTSRGVEARFQWSDMKGCFEFCPISS